MITNNGRVPAYSPPYSGPAIVAQGLRKLYGTHEAVKNAPIQKIHPPSVKHRAEIRAHRWARELDR